MDVRCLSVPEKICTFADVEIRLFPSAPKTMKKNIWQTIAEILRFVAALLAGYAGSTLN